MTRRVHTRSDAQLQADLTQAWTPEAALERAWRTYARLPVEARSVADQLTTSADPVVAAQARALGLACALRSGQSGPVQASASIDAGVLGPMWTMRMHMALLAHGLTNYRPDLVKAHAAPADAWFREVGAEAPGSDRAWALTTLGRVRYRRRDYEGACQLFREAAALYQRLGSPNSQSVCLVNLGNALSDLADTPGALDAYSAALEALDLLTPSAQSRQAMALCHANIAVVRGRMQDYADSLRYGQLALELAQPENGPGLPVNTLNVMAEAAGESGDWEAADGYLRRAEQILERHDSAILEASVAQARARWLVHQDRPTEALALLDSAPEHDELQIHTLERYNRGLAISRLGRPAEVLRIAAAALDEIREIDPGLAQRACDLVVDAHLAVGDPVAAVQVLRSHQAWLVARHHRVMMARTAERAVDLDLGTAGVREELARHDAATMHDQFMRAQRLEAVGQLAGGIAHDFNNLLTVVLGEAEAIAENPDAPSEVQESAGYIFDAANRGRAVTKRLLAFARQAPTEPGPVDLAALARDIVPMVETAVGSSVSVSVETPESAVWVFADAALLEQMLLNLALNARDAMAGRGALTLSVDVGEESATVSVADTGSGIPPEVLPRIFDPFFTTKGMEEGTGLGLAMVFGGAQQMGGEVRVSSTPGEGATFTIELSRHRSP